MKLKAQAQIRLRGLIESGTLPASRCGRAFLKLIAPLLDSGVIEKRRRGAGMRIVVNNAAALREFCRQRFPEAVLPPDAGSRLVSLSRFRDTKAMPNTENEIISLRVWRDDAMLKDGEPVGGVAADTAHGVFSFLFSVDCPYELCGSCALVESPAVFEVAEQLSLGVGAMVYGHGRISKRVVDWLARMPDSSFRLLHLPDYDPVGLSEFQRLHARLGKRVELHLPDDLGARFKEFSKPELLEKGNSRAMLAKLRRSDLPAIRRVVGLIDLHNAGLEQEALLVK
jgi:hypothetical protein